MAGNCCRIRTTDAQKEVAQVSGPVKRKSQAKTEKGERRKNKDHGNSQDEENEEKRT